MIEQPLADDGMSLINHADLQRRIETPVCLDESAHSLAHVQAAIRLGSCKVVNIKMARVGGLTASRDIQALCAEHDIPCWVGGMLESADRRRHLRRAGHAAQLHLCGRHLPLVVLLHERFGKPEIVLSGPGEVATSRVPGIAQEPDPDLLKRWTVEHASFRAYARPDVGRAQPRQPGPRPRGSAAAWRGSTAYAPDPRRVVPGGKA